MFVQARCTCSLTLKWYIYVLCSQTLLLQYSNVIYASPIYPVVHTPCVFFNVCVDHAKKPSDRHQKISGKAWGVLVSCRWSTGVCTYYIYYVAISEASFISFFGVLHCWQ